jgi:hypothetical protein
MEAVHTQPLLASLKAIFNTISQNGGLGSHLVYPEDSPLQIQTQPLEMTPHFGSKGELHLQGMIQWGL